MPDFDTVDFFRTRPLYQDPYPYYEYLRDHGPVWREPHHDVVMVCGYDEAIAVLNDTDNFSNCNTVIGPFARFPVPLEGDDISELVERYRDDLPFSDQLPAFDPPKHTAHRALLMRLITPKRLRENEEFMWRLADRQLDEFLADGRCEFVGQYANPFTLLVIADLLGVPETDHSTFREELQGEGHANRHKGADGKLAHKPLEFLYDRFTAYIEDRRRGAACRRDDGAGHRHVPRRNAARGSRRDADRVEPLRRRPGDHCPDARAPRSASSAERPELEAAAARRPGAHPHVRRGDRAAREPDPGQLPPRPPHHRGRGRPDPRGHDAHDHGGCGEPRPRSVRRSRGDAPRPRQRAPAHRLRVRDPLVRGRAACAGRGAGEPRADPATHDPHPHLGVRARAARRPPVRLHTDLHAARASSSSTSSSPRHERRRPRSTPRARASQGPSGPRRRRRSRADERGGRRAVHDPRGRRRPRRPARAARRACGSPTSSPASAGTDGVPTDWLAELVGILARHLRLAGRTRRSSTSSPTCARRSTVSRCTASTPGHPTPTPRRWC